MNLLLIADNQDDFLITKEALSNIEGQSYNLDWVDNYNRGLEKICQQEYEVYLVAYNLGKKTALAFLEDVKDIASNCPIIMLTNLDNHETNTKALQAGAYDYLVKNQLNSSLLEHSIRHVKKQQQLVIALQEIEERYIVAAECATDGLWDWNLKEDEVYYSQRWKAMLGFEEGDIGDSPNDWLERLHPDDIERVKKITQNYLKGSDKDLESEYRIRQKDGTYRWMLSRGLALRDIEGKAYRVIGWQTDLSGRIASYDSLTNLPNRTLFLDRLKRAIDYSTYQKSYKFAVLYIDIDNFKVINDSLGHALGDTFLIEVARRLEQSMRLTKPKTSKTTVVEDQNRLYRDTLARFGGDEFAILLENIKGPQDAVRIAERIQTLLAKPSTLDQQAVTSSASIGIALSDSGYDTPDNMLRDADIAMYRAKQEGKARYTLFDSSMHAQVKSRLLLEMSLKQALERNEFKVLYQPIVDLKTEKIVGCEALLRWNHPDKGLLLPQTFLELTEETGLIIRLDRWVINQACELLQHLYTISPEVRMSINLSSKYLENPNLTNYIRTIVNESKFDASCLAFEVTEGAMTQPTTQISNTLETLRSWGVLIQLDDFGTGYSSLNRLLSFPINTLKIDRSFVKEIEKDNNKEGVVQAILILAKTLGIKVIAEGVENPLQSKLLRLLGCHYAQGYLFGKPFEAEEIIKRLESQLVAIKEIKNENSRI